VLALRIGTVKNSRNFLRVDALARSMSAGAEKESTETTASSVSNVLYGPINGVEQGRTSSCDRKPTPTPHRRYPWGTVAVIRTASAPAVVACRLHASGDRQAPRVAGPPVTGIYCEMTGTRFADTRHPSSGVTIPVTAFQHRPCISSRYRPHEHR